MPLWQSLKFKDIWQATRLFGSTGKYTKFETYQFVIIGTQVNISVLFHKIPTPAITTITTTSTTTCNSSATTATLTHAITITNTTTTAMSMIHLHLSSKHHDMMNDMILLLLLLQLLSLLQQQQLRSYFYHHLHHNSYCYYKFTFIGVDSLQVHDMTNDVILVTDTVASKHVSCQTSNFQRLATWISLDHRNHLRSCPGDTRS